MSDAPIDPLVREALDRFGGAAQDAFNADDEPKATRSIEKINERYAKLATREAELIAAIEAAHTQTLVAKLRLARVGVDGDKYDVGLDYAIDLLLESP